MRAKGDPPLVHNPSKIKIGPDGRLVCRNSTIFNTVYVGKVSDPLIEISLTRGEFVSTQIMGKGPARGITWGDSFDDNEINVQKGTKSDTVYFRSCKISNFVLRVSNTSSESVCALFKCLSGEGQCSGCEQ